MTALIQCLSQPRLPLRPQHPPHRPISSNLLLTCSERLKESGNFKNLTAMQKKLRLGDRHPSRCQWQKNGSANSLLRCNGGRTTSAISRPTLCCNLKISGKLSLRFLFWYYQVTRFVTGAQHWRKRQVQQRKKHPLKSHRYYKLSSGTRQWRQSGETMSRCGHSPTSPMNY